MLSGTDMKLENYVSNIYVPQMKNKKKGSLILVTTQIEFNLKCIAQCICSKSSGLTFLYNIQNCHHFTHKSVQKCNFGFYSITGNYTNEIRLKVCQKSNISEENTVANFGFNCKNGNFSPILSFLKIRQTM